MTEKELKKLNRRQLLELMLAQSKRIDMLEHELEITCAKLDNQRIVAEETGSLAEAALRLSGVFEAAQEAADIYLKNVQKNAEQQKKGTEFDFENWLYE